MTDVVEKSKIAQKFEACKIKESENSEGITVRHTSAENK